MKRKEWILIFLPLLIVWYFDRVSKEWAQGIQSLKTYGLLNFSLHFNPGAMLGLFADLPPVLRIVSLSTGGAFLVVTYALVQYLLPIKSLVMRCGMSILLGGILGNVTDRILWGHVVDFIIVGTPSTYLSPAFNLADAFQWVGYIMVVYSVAKEGSVLWPEHNARRRYWINKKFQLKYCYMLLGVGLSISFVTMVFSYTFMKVAMVELVGPNPQIIDKFLTPYLITFSVVCVGFCLALFTVGKIVSHKIAGPIYAFEKYINDVFEVKRTKGPLRKFKMRNRDEFHELEDIAHAIKNEILPEIPDAEPLSEITQPGIE
jgi:signal peptidase II